MNDRCTAATARRLKELGFPQPAPAPGQVWCLGDRLCQVRKSRHGKSFGFYFGEVDGFWFCSSDELPNAVYAPTAPDILWELGYTHNLRHRTGVVHEFTCTYGHSTWFSDDNPAEACAKAWEAKQKRG